MSTRTLDGQTFTRLIKSGAANLKANAGIVNELNVFPIPDGDTGENMSLTIGGGLRYLEDDSENSVEKKSLLQILTRRQTNVIFLITYSRSLT